MSPSATPYKARLAVVFVQHERGKYPRALPRLIEALSTLRKVDTRYVVVDNAKPGDWSHQVSGALFHIGGDNSSWEFSAFDQGARWIESQGWPADLLLFATDALLAYGDEFLDLIDERVIDACLTLGACVGWIDSFMETSKILEHSYDSWVRTSLVFMPVEVKQRLGAMTWPLDERRLFGAGPEQPFDPEAPISHNLQALLLEWLTRDADDGQLDEVWHSQFCLDRSTFQLFKDKAKAILREHLLSARLLHSGVPCFDLRAIQQAQQEKIALEDLQGPTGQAWQWLGWRKSTPPPTPTGDTRHSEAPNEVPAQLDESPSGPVLLLRGGQGPEQLAFMTQVAEHVMPLLLQRNSRAELRIFDSTNTREVRRLQGYDHVIVESGEETTDEALAQATVVLAPPQVGEPTSPLLDRAVRLGVPIVGSGFTLDGQPAQAGQHYLPAVQPWEFARACLQLIQEPTVDAQIAKAAGELVG